MSTQFRAHAGDSLAEIAMSFHLSPSRLQVINDLFPPVISQDRDLLLEDPAEMTLCQHSIFVVLTSNDVELPGVITFFPDAFTFEQRLLSPGPRLTLSVNIVSVISCKIVPHPRAPDACAAADPGLLLIIFLADALDAATLAALSFAACRAELHALEHHIARLSSLRQAQIRYAKPKSVLPLLPEKEREAAALHRLPPRLRGRARGAPAEASSVIDRVNVVALRKALPYQFRAHAWKLAFSLVEDGTSYETLYSANGVGSPCVLLIRTSDGERFGAFVPTGLKRSARFYGTGEAFVFSFDDALVIYRWSRKNDWFVSSTNSEIVIGGGKGAALWIDDRMLNGRSEVCETFDSLPLAKKQTFQVQDLEVWSLSSRRMAGKMR
jgi:hypothetical protein